MRQVFTSPRIENVEAVAQLLREGGVEVRVSNGRGWRGKIRGNFSYRDQATRAAQPEVWVLRSEDYPRARQLLRDAGLPQGHAAGGAYLGPSMHGATTRETAGATRRPGSRARTGALLAVALAVAAGYFLVRWAASNAPPRTTQAPAAMPAAASSPIADATQVHAIPVPPALAAMLLASDAVALPKGDACVAVDGSDPAAEAIAVDASRWIAASRCEAGQARVEIGPWRTDGSGVGTVRIETVAADGGARDARTLRVERDRDDWRVLGEAEGAQ